MFITAVTTAGVASAVWSSGSRTLTADPATDAGAATLVWTHTPRNLTTVVNTVTTFGQVNLSLAAGATQDLRPAAGKFREGVMAAPQTSSVVYGIYDGTTFGSVGGTNLNSPLEPLIGNSSVGAAIKSSSGAAQNISFAGFDWS